MRTNSAADILAGFDKAKNDRLVVETGWQDVQYFVVPRKRDIQYERTAGEKTPYDVYDNTAIQSNLTLAAGLSGYMVNSSQRWFELRPRNYGLMEDKEVRNFYADSAEVMYSQFAISNFYQQIHEFFLDLGSIGTATFYQEDDVKDVFRFFARHPKEIYAIENEREIVDVVYRSFKMSAWQAYNMFGKDKVGDSIVKCVDEAKDYGKTFDFVHYVCPRHVRDVKKKDSKNLPFASYWVSLADKRIIREGGYEEFPFHVTRFYKNSTEVYGYSPAHSCYPDILMINKMMETYIKAAEISIYPPWLMEHDSMVGTLDLRAGALNYQRQSMAQGQAVKPLMSGSNFQVAINFIQRTEENIKSSFFVDLFLMLVQNVNMTATEVIERSQERMLMLGPVLGRLQTEALNPIIFRGFNQMLRAGKLPRVPEKLMGTEYDVVYVSPLAKAQRAVQAKDTQTFLAIIGQMAAFFPQIVDKVNADEVADKLSKIYSIDPDIINDDKDVDEIRAQRAQQQAQQAQMMMMGNVAKTTKDIGQAERGFADARSKSSGEPSQGK